MAQRTASARWLGTIAVLAACAVAAGDPPEIVQRKQEYSRAYNAAHAFGICEVYADLKTWQQQNWQDGRSMPEQVLRSTILPRYVSDVAVLKDKSFAELEGEYEKMCNGSAADYQRVIQSVGASDSEEYEGAANEQKKGLANSFRLARFLGQCQTASVMFLRAQLPPATRDQLHLFVLEQVFEGDPFTRMPAFERVDPSTGAELSPSSRFIAAEGWERQYWQDCDTAETKFREISEQLKIVP